MDFPGLPLTNNPSSSGTRTLNSLVSEDTFVRPKSSPIVDGLFWLARFIKSSDFPQTYSKILEDLRSTSKLRSLILLEDLEELEGNIKEGTGTKSRKH